MYVLLKAMREKRGWNQQELARRSGVPQPIISDIENRNVKHPRVDTMYKLACALRCTVDDLLAEESAANAS